MTQENQSIEFTSRIVVRRYVFAWKKTYFITEDKFCPFDGSKLVLIIDCLETDQGISTHCSPVVGDVVSDNKGIHLEVVELINL